MTIRSATAATALGAFAAAAPGAIVPFTETFSANASNWTGGAVWDPAGHIDTPTNVNAASFGVVIGPRGQASNGASGGAFVGNWFTDGVAALTFDVRHDAPLPLSFGARFASPMNFPGAIGLAFAPVPAGTWTTVMIPITPAFPGWVSFEGSDFNTVFSNVGNVQLLYSVPAALAGTGTIINFEADNVRIVPGAGTAALLVPIVLTWRRRRR
jgi:hypothetical protein